MSERTYEGSQLSLFSIQSFTVYVLDVTPNQQTSQGQELRLTCRLCSGVDQGSKLVSAPIICDPRRPTITVDQRFDFAYTGEKSLRIRLYESDLRTLVGKCTIDFPPPHASRTVLDLDVMLYRNDQEQPWGSLKLRMEFGYNAIQESVRRLKPTERTRTANRDPSPKRGVSPLMHLSPVHETLKVEFPFTGVRFYLSHGAGWKLYRGAEIEVAVALGRSGLVCHDKFTVTTKGHFNCGRVFVFPYNKERTIRVFVRSAGRIEDDSWDQCPVAQTDVIDFVNGGIVTCRQQLAFFRPDDTKALGYLDMVTEFTTDTPEKSVRHVDREGLQPGVSPLDARSPVSPSPGLKANSTEVDLAQLTGEVDLQVPNGDPKECVKSSPVYDCKTLLCEVLAVTDLPSNDQLCSVMLRLGNNASGTGAYHRVRGGKKAAVFEMHRLAYGKQKYAELILRVSNSVGTMREGVAWLDLTGLLSKRDNKTRVAVRDRTFLGYVYLRLCGVQESLKSNLPYKMSAEEIMDKRSLALIVRPDEQLVHTRSSTPGKKSRLAGFCNQSPLLSPRSRQSQMDAHLKLLCETLEPPSSEPNMMETLEHVTLQLVGLRGLPDADGLNSLSLQFVIRMGGRTLLVSEVLPRQDVNPDFESLVMHLPTMGLRFITIDVFERVIYSRPLYLGRTVIDITCVKPNEVVAGYEPTHTRPSQLISRGGAYCLFALEGMADQAPVSRTATFLTLLKEHQSPLARSMGYDSDERSTTADSEGPDEIDSAIESAIVLKLTSLRKAPSPFPFQKVDVSIVVETKEIRLTTSAVSTKGKTAQLNQLIRLPNLPSTWENLRLSILVGCPISKPVVMESQDISLAGISSIGRLMRVEFAKTGATLDVVVTKINQPCRQALHGKLGLTSPILFDSKSLIDSTR